MSFLTEETKWVNHVRLIRSFLDEDYAVKGSRAVQAISKICLPWGRIGVEKYCDRVIPHIQNGDDNTAAAEVAIYDAVYDCTAFGNSTIITDADGGVRVSSPENSIATRDVFGKITFKESFKDGTETISEDGNLLKRKSINDPWEDTGCKTFTIFNGVSSAHPNGRSRITPAVRKTIVEASLNRMRASVASDFHAYPQRILNGFWGQLKPNDNDAIKRLKVGADQIIGLPLGPNGEKLDITTFPPSDFTPFLKLHESFARDCAAAFNIDAAEMGIVAMVPSSADALYLSKEDLVLEVTRFEKSITRVLQKLLEEVAEDPKVKLTWAEPATPSKASQADAFVKLAAVIPALAQSRAALAWAGLPGELADELSEEMFTNRRPAMEVGDVPDTVPTENAILQLEN